MLVPNPVTGAVSATVQHGEEVMYLPVEGTLPASLEPEQSEAMELDKLLRDAAQDFDASWAVLEQLIARAKAEKIYTELGFRSWPEYIADVARSVMPNVWRSIEQRREIVGLLAGEGLSQRAIGDALGVSQKTVDRDLDQVSHDDSPDMVTGLDGKSYPARREVIIVDPRGPGTTLRDALSEAAVPEPTRITIPDTIEDAQARLEEIAEDEEALRSALIERLGRRIQQALSVGMNVILSLDEAQMLYRALTEEL
ncbi:MAG: helix-turn-helix domain-containing protein [Mycobacterium sp.]|uniref:helix-turn-helix domain-containing protein n=1 Tax=Mycobacterium sp. TaxID=1785 RepID=UPI003F9A9CD1